jgi:hypothetical protein
VRNEKTQQQQDQTGASPREYTQGCHIVNVTHKKKGKIIPLLFDETKLHVTDAPTHKARATVAANGKVTRTREKPTKTLQEPILAPNEPLPSEPRTCEESSTEEEDSDTTITDHEWEDVPKT